MKIVFKHYTSDYYIEVTLDDYDINVIIHEYHFVVNKKLLYCSYTRYCTVGYSYHRHSARKSQNLLLCVGVLLDK